MKHGEIMSLFAALGSFVLVLFIVIPIVGKCVGPSSGSAETIAYLDTVYNHATRQNILLAAYKYEVGGQEYWFEHKTATALPRRLPMEIEYNIDHPEICSAIHFNTRLTFYIGQKEYYVRYMPGRAKLRIAITLQQ